MSELATDQKSGVLIIYFRTDSIRTEAEVQRVGDELVNLTHSAGDKVLLDFSKLQQMSSLMIGKILALGKECTAHKITLKMCNLQPHIKEVFNATGLSRVMRIYDTQDTAIAAFRKKRWFW